MNITLNTNDRTPQKVIGLQNLTEGFWRNLRNNSVIRVGAIQKATNRRAFTIFDKSGLREPDTDVLNDGNANIPGSAAAWLTVPFERIESGSITISW